MTEEVKETNVKSDAESIVEREFASLRAQLNEVEASKTDIESKYADALKEIEAFKLAEETRIAKEELTRKGAAVEAIISREVLFGTLEEDKKDMRVEELTAWDEPRLTGFSEALAAMPEPTQEAERSFGKGKSADEGEVPESERKFGMKIVNGNIKLDPEYYRGE